MTDWTIATREDLVIYQRYYTYEMPRADILDEIDEEFDRRNK